MQDAPLAPSPLAAALLTEPTSFEFFQAVRLLERLQPERSGVGGFVDPAREVARFAARPGLAFPASEIHALELEDDAPARMTVSFLGLTGPLGVLPHVYSLLALERERARDTALRDFLDLFHHRLVSLFYRAWKRTRFTAAQEQDEDPLREHVLDLVGMGLPALREGLGFEEDALVYFAGLLALQPRGAVALQQLLEGYFRVPVQVEQFVGGWYGLPLGDRCAVGEENGASTQLGRGAVVGDEVWDPQTRVRLRLGPLSREAYDRFLPTGDAYPVLRELVRFYSHDQLEFELQLVLARDEVPGCVLGAPPAAPQPLGWATWLRTATFPRDADDTVLAL